MKTLTALFIVCLLTTLASAQIQVCFTTAEDQDSATCHYEYCSSANATFTFSKGRYRIPYQELVAVHCTNDHIKHCPRGAIDMSGVGDENTTFYIVAAADGWIRYISDSHTQSCPDGGCDNNYVWIEHPNGEWTKYVHMKYHSASDLHSEDDWVTAGTVIGKEGSVGISTGPHCHFEVAVPVDTNTMLFDEGGGWINTSWAMNLVPVWCNVTGNVMVAGEDYTAITCVGGCDAILPIFNTTYGAGKFKAFIGDEPLSNDHDILFDEASAGVMQSGSSVTLKPGFQAIFLSNFEARTGECSGAGFNKTTAEEQATSESDHLISLSPNPATQSATIHWFLDEDATVTISICDMGRRELIQSLNSVQLKSGTHQQVINVSSLLPGMYLVILEVNQTSKIQKLVVQR